MNNRFRTILFDVAAVLVLLGAILYASDSSIAPYLFAAGAAGISILKIPAYSYGMTAICR